MELLALFFLGLATLASAAGVVLFRNPVRSALSLVLTLFLVAVHFVLLQAHMVAALQVIVYAGAILVLFLFVIMLLNLEAQPREFGPRQRNLFSVLACGLVAFPLLGALLAGSAREASLPSEFGTVGALARALFGRHLLAFELTSVLLLVAIVGAVVLGHRRPSR
ncbi:MAG: NADH dehydrogenase subunit J [Candidatus Binatia bacterium]|nr:MAG: NADH dehydrogenase subunit J [Candidatus Binatia bacterium]